MFVTHRGSGFVLTTSFSGELSLKPRNERGSGFVLADPEMKKSKTQTDPLPTDPPTLSSRSELRACPERKPNGTSLHDITFAVQSSLGFGTNAFLSFPQTCASPAAQR